MNFLNNVVSGTVGTIAGVGGAAVGTVGIVAGGAVEVAGGAVGAAATTITHGDPSKGWNGGACVGKAVRQGGNRVTYSGIAVMQTSTGAKDARSAFDECDAACERYAEWGGR